MNKIQLDELKIQLRCIEPQLASKALTEHRILL